LAKPPLALVTPATVNRTVRPLRRPNAELRTREHLTAVEVEALIEAAKGNRYGHRDATMILLAFRHGLRAIELVDLEWSQVEFKAAVLHVRRAKKGTPATHPLAGRRNTGAAQAAARERGVIVRVDRRLRRDDRARRRCCRHRFQGTSAHAAPRLRLSLANAGHDTRALQAYLGHKNIQHTVRYTELAPNRFKDFWRD
jgi:site-specific recombinase XerD